MVPEIRFSGTRLVLENTFINFSLKVRSRGYSFGFVESSLGA